MPARNSIKIYYEDGYYHLYNRGVEKRKIFLDQQDYGVFLGYLKEYLLPKNEKQLLERLAIEDLSPQEKGKIQKLLRMNNFYGEIKLLAYCLMPNHFHFFIKQKSADSIDKFMNSLGTRYTMYFNKKYNRVGRLYQDVYKAVPVIREPQFIYLSKYIHKQALAIQGVALHEIQPCSYKEYIGERSTEWIDPSEVLAYFSETNPEFSYSSFVKESPDDGEVTMVNDITLEEEDDDL